MTIKQKIKKIINDVFPLLNRRGKFLFFIVRVVGIVVHFVCDFFKCFGVFLVLVVFVILKLGKLRALRLFVFLLFGL